MTERAEMTHEELEEGEVLALDFGKLKKVAGCGQDLLPVAVQDAESGEVALVDTDHAPIRLAFAERWARQRRNRIGEQLCGAEAGC